MAFHMEITWIFVKNRDSSDLTPSFLNVSEWKLREFLVGGQLSSWDGKPTL
jgi:hypothetical protein